ncbi:hypothetical protein [sulfur-oxidizing endosymbiont of Gigantopelta aegis]|uniref:hypothetical protein n=1 Tax=sulfur-oxidizing endosymbiont of Gigantopelta aegis TaxID=2794934 RepID=UPI001BE49A21|nr:hypothetical protein [sulfur-oxidizing endosymbiont of Gigantopelta aegis]
MAKVIQERDLLKGHSVLCKGNFVKYAWITDQAKDYPVTILCRFMDVSVVAIMIGLALLKRIERKKMKRLLSS